MSRERDEISDVVHVSPEVKHYLETKKRCLEWLGEQTKCTFPYFEEHFDRVTVKGAQKKVEQVRKFLESWHKDSLTFTQQEMMILTNNPKFSIESLSTKYFVYIAQEGTVHDSEVTLRFVGTKYRIKQIRMSIEKLMAMPKQEVKAVAVSSQVAWCLRNTLKKQLDEICLRRNVECSILGEAGDKIMSVQFEGAISAVDNACEDMKKLLFANHLTPMGTDKEPKSKGMAEKNEKSITAKITLPPLVVLMLQQGRGAIKRFLENRTLTQVKFVSDSALTVSGAQSRVESFRDRVGAISNASHPTSLRVRVSLLFPGTSVNSMEDENVFRKFQNEVPATKIKVQGKRVDSFRSVKIHGPEIEVQKACYFFHGTVYGFDRI